MTTPTGIAPKYKQSKFIFDLKTFEVVWGKVPQKKGQLWKGETTCGSKMEFAGSDYGPVAYDGWS